MEAQYPYQAERGLLGDYASIFSGLPLGSEGQSITPISKPSTFGQLAGFGLQAAGMLGGAGTGSILGKLLGMGASSAMGGTGGGIPFNAQRSGAGAMNLGFPTN